MVAGEDSMGRAPSQSEEGGKFPLPACRGLG